MQPVIAIRAFIASPSDVKEERNIAVQVVTEWNAAHSLDRNALVEAVRMETHAEAALGKDPQELINQQLLDRCDFLIAIFWSKLGTPTNKAVSGTVHEIKDFAQQKGPENVMVFFSEKDYPHGIDPEELKRIQDFKKEMDKEGFYISYQNDHDFRQKLRQQIEMRLNKILSSEETKRLWSEQAVMDAQSKMELESAQNFIEDMAEQRRSRSEANQAFREKMLGVSSEATDSPSLTKDLLCKELQKVFDHLNRRFTECEKISDSANAISLFRMVSKRLNDIFVRHGGVMTESETGDIVRLSSQCKELSDAAASSQISDFWIRAKKVIQELYDYIALL